MTSHHLYILTGASRGMGLAMAQQLLRPTNALICISRTANLALSAQADASSCMLVQWQQDLADAPVAARRLSDWLASKPGDAYASATLINNAGVIGRIAPLRDASPADLANAMRVGLEAPIQLSAAFLAGTRNWHGPRRLLNISSGLGRRAMQSQAPYCAAKAGMDSFSQCVALEEAGLPNGARVCSLAPGVVDTDMQVQMRSAQVQHFPDQTRFEALHASGLLTSPEEAAKRVLAWLEKPDFGAQPVADVRDELT